MGASPRQVLTYDGFHPDEEGLREAICALGNGVFVTRSACSWSRADGVHYPGTYLAGGYDRATSQIAGRDVENEDLVNLPNWLPVTFRVDDGSWFRGGQEHVRAYRLALDMDEGLARWRARLSHDGIDAMAWSERRAVHLADPRLAVQEVTFELDDDADAPPGRVTVRAGIDGSVQNSGVERYDALDGRHLDVLDTSGRRGDAVPGVAPPASTDSANTTVWVVARTKSSRLRIAVGARIEIDGLSDPGEPYVVTDGLHSYVERSGRLEPGRRVTVRKVVAIASGRDRAGYEPLHDVRSSLGDASDIDSLFESQCEAWRRQWERSHLQLRSGDEWADLVLHLHLFHLHQTVSDHTADLDVGIPARGWHGEAYRGHIFWDELFVLPFLDYRFPLRARAAIRYRARRLPVARRAARQLGYRGAMFPWQSGSTGREESQQWHLNPRSGRWNPDPTHLQRHSGIAIAYNVWQHWQVTADHEFLYEAGAPLLLEIADFFASIAEWDGGRERFVIRGVIGPDEYHTRYPDASEPGLDNNAYTNVMSAWVLRRALDVLAELPPRRQRELCRQLDLDEDRLEHWRLVSTRLFVPFLSAGLIEQFEGYGELEEFDWDRYRERYGDISRLDRILEAEGDTTNRYQASKQADVAMLFYLLSSEELVALFDDLGYRLRPDDIPRNIDHYMARTSHGSTLSSVVHAWVLARSDRAASWKWYRRALESDVKDVQGGTTPEGIHLGAMAGTIELVQRAYTGLNIDGDVVRFNPRLPTQVDSLTLTLHFRTHWDLQVEVTQDELTVRCETVRGEGVAVAVKDEHALVGPGETHRFDLAELKS
jgi:alpha,alpha-trehalase